MSLDVFLFEQNKWKVSSKLLILFYLNFSQYLTELISVSTTDLLQISTIK